MDDEAVEDPTLSPVHQSTPVLKNGLKRSASSEPVSGRAKKASGVATSDRVLRQRRDRLNNGSGQ